MIGKGDENEREEEEEEEKEEEEEEEEEGKKNISGHLIRKKSSNISLA